MTPSPLSVDDLAIGEILIALKRDPVVHDAIRSPQPVLSPGATSAFGGYRTKMDLKVTTPTQDEAALFSRLTFNSVSPMASSLYARPPTATAQSPSERTKRYGPVIQLEDLRKCFNMPIAAVARQFGICATLLKKICRRHGIQRWPHRQIRSLQKSIDMLRESLAVAKGSNKEYIAKKIAAFEYTLECIMQDPNTAAKGISTGRLASPASEELAKRAKRAKEMKHFESAAALAAISDDDEEDRDLDDQAPWSPTASPPSSSMSIQSILC